MAKKFQAEIKPDVLDRLRKVQVKAGFYISITNLARLAMLEGLAAIEKRFK